MKAMLTSKQLQMSSYTMKESSVLLAEVNECERHPLPCHQSAYCTNTVGSYDCTCLDGYAGDGTECTIDSRLIRYSVLTS